MRMVIGFIVVLCLAAAAEAEPLAVVQRSTPLGSTHLKLQVRTADLSTQEGPAVPAFSRVGKGGAVLTCENDDVIDPSSTLRLLPGDMAGNIFEVDPELTPYQIDTISLGLLPQATSTLPVLIGLDFFVYEEASDNFQFVTGFDITIDDVDPEGTIFDIDLSEFDIEGNDDLLTLYGDFTNDSEDDRVNPAGDNSPRCLNAAGDNVCSVLLPFDDAGLLIYGITDMKCPEGILNFDLVHDVVLKSPIATQSSSWGNVKSRF